MAFVFRATNKDPLKTQSLLPGPGQYMGRDSYNIVENRVAFNSTTTKDQFTSNQDPSLGPGTYNISKDILAPEKTQNVFFMPADPDKEELEQIKTTSAFKSKTKRFVNKDNSDTPGPDKYDNNAKFGKQQKKFLPREAPIKLEEIKNAKNKKIPSIPSNVHSYGYTENDEHDLVLNKDPLAQFQEYVGPGYYDLKENPQASKYKGYTWHKSGVKKLESFASQTATTQIVGPGTYEAPETSLQVKNTKANAGFVSTTTRSFDAYVKQKLGGKFQSRTPMSSQSEARGISQAETDADDEEDDEYMKEATPGPGYYYNDSMLSSFGTSSSEFSRTAGMRGTKTKPLGFGRCQRFKEQQTTTGELGPGDYEMKINPIKMQTRAKIPFQSSNTRFDREYPRLNPGPGAYDAPTTIVDRVKDKAKAGYVGSFGITEKRFKISKLVEETPGPGTYIQQEQQKNYVEDITASFKKGSYYFASSCPQRNAFVARPDNLTAPGSYELAHLNIATKVAKEEDDADLPKRYPFNSGQERFEKPKEKVILEDEDEDDEDEPRFGPSGNIDSLLKKKMKPKASSVFQSKTGRTVPGHSKNVAPGPGSYHDSQQNMWNKRTFNVHFTG